MDWSVFVSALVVWIFFGSHYDFSQKAEQLAGQGFAIVPAGFLGASKTICVLAILNLLTFFVVYGVKVSWVYSGIAVFGSYIASLIYAWLTSAAQSSTLAHKVGWIAIPLFSVCIWLLAFRA